LFHNIHPPYQVEKFHGNYIVNCPHQLWAHSQTPTRSILNTNSFSTSLQPLKVPDYGMQFAHHALFNCLSAKESLIKTCQSKIHN
jgi:hypothetical protein